MPRLPPIGAYVPKVQEEREEMNKDAKSPLTIYREPERTVISICRWKAHEGSKGLLRTHKFYIPSRYSLKRIEQVAGKMKAHEVNHFITSYV